MGIFKKLFRKKRNVNARINAAVTIVTYEDKGWLENIMNDEDEIIGFWSAYPQPQEIEKDFLIMAAIKEKLSEASYISISLGYYRVVENNDESKGGVFFMIGDAKAPNEVVSLLESFNWKQCKPNPKSNNIVVFKEKDFLFAI